MWTRQMLKTNARAAIKKNYVNVLVVSLIFAFISGAFSSSSASKTVTSSFKSGNFSKELISFAAMLIGISIVIGIIGILLSILVFNPLKVGIQKFFIENHYANPGIGLVAYAFKTNYINVVKTMFLRDIYLFLWSLLLAIPGIIKSYSYRLVPYILADNPDIYPDDAITLSREMMNGHKLDAFILDISFILWWLLSVITFNIAGVFYVFPYIDATNAELYLALANNSSDSNNSYFNDTSYNGGDYYE